MQVNQHWTTKDRCYGIFIEQFAWEQISKACIRAEKNETGGILIGYYANGQQTAIITQISTPSDSKSGRHWFKRGVSGLASLLRKSWQDPQKTYYLGEWHYHPVSVIQPSDEDFQQMITISQSPNFQCKEPIMIIIGKEKSSLHAKAWVFPSGESPLEFCIAAQSNHTP